MFFWTINSVFSFNINRPKLISTFFQLISTFFTRDIFALCADKSTIFIFFFLITSVTFKINYLFARFFLWFFDHLTFMSCWTIELIIWFIHCFFVFLFRIFTRLIILCIQYVFFFVFLYLNIQTSLTLFCLFFLVLSLKE